MSTADAVECLAKVADIVDAEIRAKCDLKVWTPSRAQADRAAWADDALFTRSTEGYLEPHQRSGVRFVKSRYDCGFGTILGDEMGLGKTRQAIGAMVQLRMAGVRGPMLVMAPVALISTWQKDILDFIKKIGMERTCPLPVVYVGSHKEEADKDGGGAAADAGARRRPNDHPTAAHASAAHRSRAPILDAFLDNLRDDEWSIMITTHNMMTQTDDFEAIRGLPGRADRPTRWALVVVDEAHRAKNPRSRMHRHLMRLGPDAFLLLTGTFVHNNLHDELLALVKLMLPPCLQCYDIASHIDSLTDNDLWDAGTGMPTAAVQHIARILSAFLIRRVFGMKGEVSTRLPMRRHFTIRFPQTPLQRRVYDIQRAKRPPPLTKAEKAAKKKAAAAKKKAAAAEEAPPENPEKAKKDAVYLKKRGCDVHPFLLREYFRQDDLPDPLTAAALLPPGATKSAVERARAAAYRQLDDLVIAASNKMRVLFELLDALIANGHRTLIFASRTAALAMIALLLEKRGITYDVITGSTKPTSRPAHMTTFQEEGERAAWVMLLSTTAMGQGVTLTHADTVIFYEHHDNPQNDKQAEARAYRIRQTRPVAVIRLVTDDTQEAAAMEGHIAAKRKIQDWFEYDLPLKRAPRPPAETQPVKQSWDVAKDAIMYRGGWNEGSAEHVQAQYIPPAGSQVGVSHFSDIIRGDKLELAGGGQKAAEKEEKVGDDNVMIIEDDDS